MVAPGSIAVLFGANLTTQTQSAASLPLPTTLGGVSAKIAGKPAPLFFVSPSQLNLQVPSGLNAGTATIEVLSGTSTTPIATGTVTVTEAAPGVFTFSANGRGQAAALNADYSSNGSFDSLPGARPEAAGSFVTIFATGIGATSMTVPDGHAAPGSPLVTGVGAMTARRQSPSAASMRRCCLVD